MLAGRLTEFPQNMERYKKRHFKIWKTVQNFAIILIQAKFGCFSQGCEVH